MRWVSTIPDVVYPQTTNGMRSSQKRGSRTISDSGVPAIPASRDGSGGTVAATTTAPARQSTERVSSDALSEIPRTTVAIGSITTWPPAVPAVNSPKIISPFDSTNSPAT